MTRDSTSRIPYLPLALLAALILSLLPSRFLRWTEPVSEPLDAVIAPIAQAGTTAARWLRPPRSTNYSSEDEPVIEDLRAEIEKFRTHALNLEAQLRRLKAESEELRQARLLNPGSHDMLLDFPVIRGSSEMGSSFIKIKGGRNRGIINGAVAVYRGVHLVGRVIRVEAVTSTIQPITDAGADYIECVIMPPGNDVTMTSGAKCQLKPRQDHSGVLTGDVQRGADWLKDIQNEKLLVRLSDPHWPRGAQALIVGVVERVFTDDANPLRLRVDVKPVYFPLNRLPRVTLRIPATDDTEQAGPNPAGSVNEGGQ